MTEEEIKETKKEIAKKIFRSLEELFGELSFNSPEEWKFKAWDMMEKLEKQVTADDL